jgi:RNA polymerase sigma factor (TIGR02999 family)
MTTQPPDDNDRRDTVTRLLRQCGVDQPDRAHELLPLIYDELRALAAARMAREGAGQTIQATALVHEAYLRLIGSGDPGWNSRRHFFAAAALAMRRILVERARRRAAIKHGGALDRLEWDDAAVAIDPPDDRVLEIDELVHKLEAHDPRKGQIVNLRCFVGFSAEETAEAMGLSLGTIEREWRFIKVWLKDELQRGAED